jgi:hypothetical protein
MSIQDTAMRVHPSLSTVTGAAAPATSQATAAPASSFQDTLAHAARTTPPPGERTEAVPGETYRDIISGPRNGMYLCTKGRHEGQAFVLVKRDGREFHIYGTGRNREVVEVHARDAKPGSGNAESRHAPAGEKTEAVSGHRDYSHIVAGPRDGLYLNTSGNVRDGKAFRLDRRTDREYHIYGSGQDRIVVCVRYKPAASDAAGGPAASGGASTPTTQRDLPATPA